MSTKTTGVVLFGLAAILAGCGNDQQAKIQDRDNETSQAQTASADNDKATAAAAIDKAALVDEAKSAVMALGGPLKTQLQAALKTGGPAEAVDICHKIAPELARSVSAEKGVDIMRVSLKNRNPELGAPNAWQAAVLNEFEARKQSGEDPKTLSYAQIVDNQFRFMKAVPTAAVCLNCHGSDLKPEVTAKLNEWYPNDKATGYQEGDIRGAFVVTKNLTL
jgi:hypothetical protein